MNIHKSQTNMLSSQNLNKFQDPAKKYKCFNNFTLLNDSVCAQQNEEGLRCIHNI